MTGPEIIKEIIKLYKNTFFDYDNNYIKRESFLYKEIFKNFDINGNTPISDLDKNHVWIHKNNNVEINVPILTDRKKDTIEEYLYAIKYHCKETGSTGYTFQYKSYVIKPFLIINHYWEHILKDDFHIMKDKNFLYKCKTCGTSGSRKLGSSFILNTENTGF